MEQSQIERDATLAIEATSVPVTPTLVALTTAALDTALRQRTADYPLRMLAKDSAHSIAAHAGLDKCVEAATQNNRLCALRLEGLDIPSNPSVQDVAVATVQAVIEAALSYHLEVVDKRRREED